MSSHEWGVILELSNILYAPVRPPPQPEGRLLAVRWVWRAPIVVSCPCDRAKRGAFGVQRKPLLVPPSPGSGFWEGRPPGPPLGLAGSAARNRAPREERGYQVSPPWSFLRLRDLVAARHSTQETFNCQGSCSRQHVWGRWLLPLAGAAAR